MTSLHVSHPQDGSPLEHGRVYIAPPDRHLIIEDTHATALIGPKENLHRPAIDTLFRSAARRFRMRVIGVVLTGMLDDGTAGMWEIKRRGGITVVQDPKDAQYPQMPRSVLDHVSVDYCVPLEKISSLLDSLCRQNVLDLRKKASPPEERIMKAHDTHLTCPECGGPLQHLKYGKLNGFRCRTGHTFSTQSALTAHAVAEEAALWRAVVALEEGADLARELASSVEPRFSGTLRNEAEAKKSLAKSIRGTLQTLSEVTSPIETTPGTRANGRSSKKKKSRRKTARK